MQNNHSRWELVDKSIPACQFNGIVAQLVEQETFNLLVEGSSPSDPTTFITDSL